jgi:hypothetical protein
VLRYGYESAQWEAEPGAALICHRWSSEIAAGETVDCDPY